MEYPSDESVGDKTEEYQCQQTNPLVVVQDKVFLLQAFGKKHSNTRSQVVGHICIGQSHSAIGNHQEALQHFQRALEIATDPFYREWARISVASAYFMLGDFEKAEPALTKVAAYIEKCGCETMSTATDPRLGAIMISKGNMSKGLEIIMKCYQTDREKKWGFGMAAGELTLANVFAQVSKGTEKPKLSVLAKNLKFVVRNAPFAYQKAEDYFKRAIETAKRYQAQGLLGQAYFDLGNLYLSKNKHPQARNCFLLAEKVFKALAAGRYLSSIQRTLQGLGD